MASKVDGMKKKKVAFIVLIITCVVILSVFGGYYFTSKTIDFDVNPPNTRTSHIMIYVNDDIVFDRIYNRNESSPILSPDISGGSGHEITGYNYRIRVFESEVGIEKEVTFNIINGKYFRVVFHDQDRITISQRHSSPKYY